MRATLWVVLLMMMVAHLQATQAMDVLGFISPQQSVASSILLGNRYVWNFTLDGTSGCAGTGRSNLIVQAQLSRYVSLSVLSPSGMSQNYYQPLLWSNSTTASTSRLLLGTYSLVATASYANGSANFSLSCYERPQLVDGLSVSLSTQGASVPPAFSAHSDLYSDYYPAILSSAGTAASRVFSALLLPSSLAGWSSLFAPAASALPHVFITAQTNDSISSPLYSPWLTTDHSLPFHLLTFSDGCVACAYTLLIRSTDSLSSPTLSVRELTSYSPLDLTPAANDTYRVISGTLSLQLVYLQFNILHPVAFITLSVRTTSTANSSVWMLVSRRSVWPDTSLPGYDWAANTDGTTGLATVYIPAPAVDTLQGRYNVALVSTSNASFLVNLTLGGALLVTSQPLAVGANVTGTCAALALQTFHFSIAADVDTDLVDVVVTLASLPLSTQAAVPSLYVSDRSEVTADNRQQSPFSSLNTAGSNVVVISRAGRVLHKGIYFVGVHNPASATLDYSLSVSLFPRTRLVFGRTFRYIGAPLLPDHYHSYDMFIPHGASYGATRFVLDTYPYRPDVFASIYSASYDLDDETDSAGPDPLPTHPGSFYLSAVSSPGNGGVSEVVLPSYTSCSARFGCLWQITVWNNAAVELSAYSLRGEPDTSASPLALTKDVPVRISTDEASLQSFTFPVLNDSVAVLVIATLTTPAGTSALTLLVSRSPLTGTSLVDTRWQNSSSSVSGVAVVQFDLRDSSFDDPSLGNVAASMIGTYYISVLAVTAANYSLAFTYSPLNLSNGPVTVTPRPLAINSSVVGVLRKGQTAYFMITVPTSVSIINLTDFVILVTAIHTQAGSGVVPNPDLLLSSAVPLPTAANADVVSNDCCSGQEMILLTGRDMAPYSVQAGQVLYVAVYASNHDMQYTLTSSISQRTTLSPAQNLTRMSAAASGYPAGTVHLFDWSFPQNLSTTSYHEFTLALTFPHNLTARGSLQVTEVLSSYDDDYDPYVGSDLNAVYTPVPSLDYQGGAFIAFSRRCTVRLNKTCLYHALVYLETATPSFTVTLSSVRSNATASFDVQPVQPAAPLIATLDGGVLAYYSFAIPYYGCQVSVSAVADSSIPGGAVGLAVNSAAALTAYPDTSAYNYQWIASPSASAVVMFDWTAGTFQDDSPQLPVSMVGLYTVAVMAHAATRVSLNVSLTPRMYDFLQLTALRINASLADTLVCPSDDYYIFDFYSLQIPTTFNRTTDSLQLCLAKVDDSLSTTNYLQLYLHNRFPLSASTGNYLFSFYAQTQPCLSFPANSSSSTVLLPGAMLYVGVTGTDATGQIQYVLSNTFVMQNMPVPPASSSSSSSSPSFPSSSSFSSSSSLSASTSRSSSSASGATISSAASTGVSGGGTSSGVSSSTHSITVSAASCSAASTGKDGAGSSSSSSSSLPDGAIAGIVIGSVVGALLLCLALGALAHGLCRPKQAPRTLAPASERSALQSSHLPVWDEQSVQRPSEIQMLSMANTHPIEQTME